MIFLMSIKSVLMSGENTNIQPNKRVTVKTVLGAVTYLLYESILILHVLSQLLVNLGLYCITYYKFPCLKSHLILFIIAFFPFFTAAFLFVVLAVGDRLYGNVVCARK